MPRPLPNPITTPRDMALSRAHAASLHASPADLPCSFLCGETQISGIPDAWQPVSTRRTVDANLVETVHEGMAPKTGCRIPV